MLNRNLPKSLALISMFALGGCQFLGNLHLAGKSRDNHASGELAAVTYGIALQEGRGYLRGNMPGLAIDAFNRALASGEDPAAAYNGLGVAYARLGRADLAYRFFSKATMSDPANPAYAHNLTSLVNSPQFTLNLMVQKAANMPAQVEPAAERTAEAAVPVLPVPGKLHRDGNRQFSLITVEPAQQVAGTSVRSAAADTCVSGRKLRSQPRCGLNPLPKVGSRTAKTEQVALAAPTASVKLAPVTDPAAAAPAPVGKTKTFDLLPGSLPAQTVPAKPVSPSAAS
jgi:hypothetical protein